MYNLSPTPQPTEPVLIFVSPNPTVMRQNRCAKLVNQKIGLDLDL